MQDVSKRKNSFKDKTCYLYVTGAIAVFCIQPVLTPTYNNREKWVLKCKCE